jgi:hypothetical protein
VAAESERLLDLLRQSLDAPGSEQEDPADIAARFRHKVETATARGLWPENANPLHGLRDAAGGEFTGIYSPAPESISRQWSWVTSLLRRQPDRPRLDALEEATTVGLLNTYLPSAFTVPVGAEHLVLVDNAFHDFIYGSAKYLVFATDPVDPDDPLWRTPRANLPGRFYAAARLLRLVLGGIRWHGFVHFPIDALLPEQLTSIAVDEYTEPAQLFILAHEAGHILSGHFATGGHLRLAVGPVELETVDCSEGVEFEADLVAAEVLVEEAVASGLPEPAARAHSLQAAHIFFTLLALYTEHYFVVPPRTHPEPGLRFDRLARHLFPDADDERSTELARRPSFRTLPRLAMLARADFRGDVPLEEFLAEVRASRYTYERVRDESMDLYEVLERMDDFLSTPVEDSLRTVAERLLPAGTVAGVPAAVTERAARALDGTGTVAGTLAAECGRLLLVDDELVPALAGYRSAAFSVPAGTAFHRWSDGLRAVLPAELVLPGLHVATVVLRSGPEALAVLPGPDRDETVAGLRAYLAGVLSAAGR